MEEQIVEESVKKSARASISPNVGLSESRAIPYGNVGMPEYIRTKTGIGELDRVLGGGVVHPHVLENCGIDPNVYSGIAFGIGIERVTNLKYNVPDMRLLFENDLRFLSQFGEGKV